MVCLDMKKAVAALLGYLIMAALVLLVLAGVILGIVVLMRFFGFTYESLGSLLLFFTAVMVLGFPLELVSKALPKALLGQGKLSFNQARGMFVLLDSLSTIIVMRIADEQMSGIYASDASVLVAALAMALLLMNDLNQEKAG